MIRKLNYTGRKKIEHANVQILINETSGKKSFDLKLDLSRFPLPPQAKIYVEPYYKTSFMRFDFGTVEELIKPQTTQLNEILNSNNVLFDIKVVDESGRHGRLLAIAKQVRPIELSNDTVNRKSILWVEYNKELGQQLWKVSFLSDMPTLEVNRNIEMTSELIKSDPIFFALVYPSVVRQIVNKIILDKTNNDLDSDEWQSLWLIFIREVLNIDLPNLEEDYNDEKMVYWVDEVVSAFCMKNRTLDRYNNQLAK